MRYLNYQTRRLNGSNLPVLALDTPPPGFANSRYEIQGFNTVYNPRAVDAAGYPSQFTKLPVIFKSSMSGGASDGVTLESLVAVCCDHLSGVQNTLEARPQYDQALTHLFNALALLEADGEPQPFPPQPSFNTPPTVPG